MRGLPIPRYHYPINTLVLLQVLILPPHMSYYTMVYYYYLLWWEMLYYCILLPIITLAIYYLCLPSMVGQLYYYSPPGTRLCTLYTSPLMMGHAIYLLLLGAINGEIPIHYIYRQVQVHTYSLGQQTTHILMLVHSSITPSLTTRYYMYILYCSPCLETSYNILLHIATWWDTSIYILVVLHTLVYHLPSPSTTYTLVILAIYYWGTPNTNMLPSTYIPIYSTYYLLMVYWCVDILLLVTIVLQSSTPLPGTHQHHSYTYLVPILYLYYPYYPIGLLGSIGALSCSSSLHHLLWLSCYSHGSYRRYLILLPTIYNTLHYICIHVM